MPHDDYYFILDEAIDYPEVPHVSADDWQSSNRPAALLWAGAIFLLAAAILVIRGGHWVGLW